MNNREKAALDNHITGGNYHRDTVTFTCCDVDCQEQWEVSGAWDYGAFYPDNEDTAYICPECGKEVED